jgi:hypothetical protein
MRRVSACGLRRRLVHEQRPVVVLVLMPPWGSDRRAQPRARRGRRRGRRRGLNVQLHAIPMGMLKLGQLRAARRRRRRRRRPLARTYRDEQASASAYVLSPLHILTPVKILPTSPSRILLGSMANPEKSWTDRVKERTIRAREKLLSHRTQPATRNSQPSPSPSTRTSFSTCCSGYGLNCSS